MTLLEIITNTLDEKKAENIVTIDFREENSMYGHFVVADAPSFRQVKAMAEFVVEAIEKAGYSIKHLDLERESSWVLIDAYDVVVHLFMTEERSRYNLEKLYADYLV